MKKAKQRFIVYWNTSLGTLPGMSEATKERYLVGETYAVSEAQAINNVRYKTKDESKAWLVSPGFQSNGWFTAVPALDAWNRKWNNRED